MVKEGEGSNDTPNRNAVVKLLVTQFFDKIKSPPDIQASLTYIVFMKISMLQCKLGSSVE